ncbi:MAG: beta-galactosidase [Bryobacteraceae bacterium]
MRTSCLPLFAVLATALTAGSPATPGRLTPTAVYHFDLSGKPEPIIPAALKLGANRSPDGQEFGLNGRHFLKDGKPWFPIMGELHFSRYPRQYWEEALLKMKAGGVGTVATYVFWIHHEEVEGQWDWADGKSLRDFLQLCARHGLKAFVRIGPWAHGEARNGGFPDWLLTKGFTPRTNDPRYLAYARKLYEQIYGQCRGLLFKDGGPVIGIQIENELTSDAEHLRTLKAMAREIGFDVPFYTATGWMSVLLPEGELLPVWAAYPDMPWERNEPAPIPPRKHYLFTGGLDLFPVNMMDAPGAGLDLARLRSEKLLDKAVWLPKGFPYAMAELGGGIQITEWRRPVLSAKDIAALSYTALGKGANLLGYYMFQGGSQPPGKLTGMEEPGCPAVSYDFQAPLGEFGDASESYHRLRALHLFLEDFSAQMTLTVPVLPPEMPSQPTDAGTLRSIVRAADGKGFLFWSNYHRGVRMTDLGPLQFELKLKDEQVLVPAEPVTLKKDTFGIWPINLSLADALLRYSTAQPLGILAGEDGIPTFFFFASEGVAPEFVFDSRTVRRVETECGDVSSRGNSTRALSLSPGTGCLIRVRTAAGKRVRILTLTNEQSRQYWKANLAGKDHVFLSADDLQFGSGRVTADSVGSRPVSLAVYPAVPLLNESGPTPLVKTADGIFLRYELPVPPKTIEVAAEPESRGKWRLKLPKGALDGLVDIFVDVQFTGERARLWSADGSRLLGDRFYSGPAWRIGLRRFAPTILAQGALLEITPLKKSATMFLEARPSFTGEEIARIDAVRAVPVHRAVFRAETLR